MTYWEQGAENCACALALAVREAIADRIEWKRVERLARETEAAISMAGSAARSVAEMEPARREAWLAESEREARLNAGADVMIIQATLGLPVTSLPAFVEQAMEGRR